MSAGKNTMGKVGQRAMQGSALGPWGTVGGMLVGGVESMFEGPSNNYDPSNPLWQAAKNNKTGGNMMGYSDPGSPPQTASGGGGYQPNPAAFQAPTAGEYFGPQSGQPGAWWMEQAGVLGGNKGHVGDSRTQRNQARQTQQAGLGLLGQYARGDKSAARRAAQAQNDATIHAIAAQTAAAPGGWNPSVQAAATRAQAGAGQQIAGQTAAAAAAEQLAAQKAYLQATGQMRQQDIAGQLAEQQWYSQQAAAKMAYQNMKAKYLALGMAEKDADRRAAMELENMRMQSAQGATTAGLTQQQINNQQSRYNSNRFDNYLMGALNSGSSYLQNYGQGQSGNSGGGGNSGSSGSSGSSNGGWGWW